MNWGKFRMSYININHLVQLYDVIACHHKCHCESRIGLRVKLLPEQSAQAAEVQLLVATVVIYVANNERKKIGDKQPLS